MSIRLVCPGCRKQLAVPDTAAGQMGRCPACNTLFNVPGSIQAQPPHRSAPPLRRTAVAQPIPQPVLGEDAPATGLTVGQKIAFAVVAAGVVAAAGFFVHRSMKADSPAPDEGRQVADAAGKLSLPVKEPVTPIAVQNPPETAESKPPVRIAPPVEDAPLEEDVGTKPSPPSRPLADAPAKPPVVANDPPKPATDPPPRRDSPKTEAAPPRSVPEKPTSIPAPPLEPIRLGGANHYDRLLKSTVMVLRPEESAGRVAVARGSGSFVHRDQKLVLTNYHVVGDAKEVFVAFPIHEGGNLLVESKVYLDKLLKKELIRGKVVRVLKGQDLALVQLDKVPDGTPVLRLAGRNARPGDVVHSIGNPGASDAAWLYTKGEVRQVSHKKWKSTGGGGGGNPGGGPGRGLPGGIPGGIPGGGIPGGGSPGGIPAPSDILEFEADVLETTSPTNPGDSGGPLVNEGCQLVGVTQGANTRARSVSLFINVTEVRKILKEQGVDGESGGDSAGGSEPPGPSNPAADEIARGLNSPDAATRAQAASRLADLGSVARSALPALIRALADADRSVRKQAGNALLQIGLPERGDIRRSDLISLRACLRDESAGGDVQRWAIKAIMLLGTDAKAAVAELGPLVKGEDKETRTAALGALEKLGAAAQTVLADIAAVMKSDDRFQNGRAAMAVVKIDPELKTDEGKAAVPILIALQKPLAVADLENKELIAFVNDAVKALVALGKPAVPALRKAMITEYKGGSAVTGEDYANAVARHAFVRILEAMGPIAYSAELDRDLAALETRDPAVAVREAAKSARAKIRPGK
jgi:S1-C subfamily serine protease/HEAT repeat protein